VANQEYVKRLKQGAVRGGAGFGRACLPSSIIGFFYDAFQPHLDEMQHAPINNPARNRG
jgi:hypothetical protein